MNILSQPQQPQLKPTNHLSDQLKPSTPKPNTLLTNNDNKITNNDKFNMKNNKVIWDCGSSLYDSFELDSFRKQLDYAIVNSSRTLSMPRLPSDNLRGPPPQPQPQQEPVKKPTSSKLSRSIHKLLRSVFRAHKPDKNLQKPDTSPDPWFFDSPGLHEDKYYVVYEKANINDGLNGPNKLNGLGSIPEVAEVTVSPQIGSLPRRTMSDRFASTSRGIYCA
ncbi:hypothetical protein vseg_006246 [Gypsophila vaccaria]